MNRIAGARTAHNNKSRGRRDPLGRHAKAATSIQSKDGGRKHKPFQGFGPQKTPHLLKYVSLTNRLLIPTSFSPFLMDLRVLLQGNGLSQNFPFLLGHPTVLVVPFLRFCPFPSG